MIGQPHATREPRSRARCAARRALTETALSLAALMLVVAAAPSGASAQPRPDENKAREHFTQAEMYMKAEVYDKAIDEYLRGYEYAPEAHGFLFNIGLAYQKMGAKQKALTYYERYLEREPTGIKAAEARARAEALRRALEREKPPEPDVGPDRPADPGITPLVPPGSGSTPGGPGPSDSGKKSALGWILAGSALIAAGLAADLLPGSGSNGSFDATDLLPVGLYGAGGVLVIRGVF